MRKIDFGPDLGFTEIYNLIKVIRSGQLSQGKFSKNFKKDLDVFLDVENTKSYLTNSGTSSLLLALLSLNLHSDDEVIVPALTFGATANAVLLAGAKVVMADVTEKDFLLDVSKLESLITSKTRVIIVVHLFGMPCDLSYIATLAVKYNLTVIEDAAQAFGAIYKNKSVGTQGDFGCFSFYPTKIITSGEGGLITFKDQIHSSKISMLINQGMRIKYEYELPGYNFRLDELSAAVGLAQLQKAKRFIKSRRNVASYYLSKLKGCEFQFENLDSISSYSQFSVRTESNRRKLITKHFAEQNIPYSIFYPKSLDEFQVYGDQKECLISQKLSNELISLPISSRIRKFQLDKVIKAFNGA